MGRTLIVSVVLALSLSACIQSPTQETNATGACAFGQTVPPDAVPECLHAAAVISAIDEGAATRVINDATSLRDSLRSDTSIAAFTKASQVTRSLIDLTQMYTRGLLEDSARFHRLVDHVAVTAEVVRGTVRYVSGKIAPATTPYLLWVSYPSNGVFFQPVSTLQNVGFLFVRANAPTDSLISTGNALWQYAIWRVHRGLRFPVWEYEFSFNSGGVTNDPPWISSQAQGYALILFSELHRRTGDQVWRDRAYAVLNSFKVLWDDGGVLLPDTSQGYWWEEFSPFTMIWNGSAQAALGVGEMWQETNDPEVKRMFDRSIQALKYYTPNYDTGTWTLYSRTQGYTTVAYHRGCVQIMDALYTVSSDPWFKAVADRWRNYVPPPGVY